MTDLKPCPFCGGEAKLMHMDLDSIEEGWQVWGVWCVDDLHAEEHGGYQHGHCIDNYATAEEAIEAWNTCADDYKQAAEYWKRMYEETIAERTGERESAEVWNQWSANDVTCSEEILSPDFDANRYIGYGIGRPVGRWRHEQTEG